MLGHHDQTDNCEVIAISHLLQNLKHEVATLGSAQYRLPSTTAPRDEVQRSRLVVPSQAPRHASKIAWRGPFVGDFLGEECMPLPNVEFRTHRKKPHFWQTRPEVGHPETTAPVAAPAA